MKVSPQVVIRCGLTALLALPVAAAARAQAPEPERLSDKDVVQIIDDVNQARDRFEDQLDGKLKESIIRRADGEVSVGHYLDDLQENVKKLKERFTRKYSASQEAEMVLKQSTDIDTRIKAQPGVMKGGSEWDRMTVDLGRLASAYGTTFPLMPNAAVRRINDEEAATIADEVAKSADKVKKAIDADTTLAKPERDTAKNDVDAVVKQAKVVKSRASDSKPGTAEVRDLLHKVDTVGTFMQHSSRSPSLRSAWGDVQPPLEKLRQAYGIK